MKLFGIVITTKNKLNKEFNIEESRIVKEFRKRNEILEKENLEQFKKIRKLEEENLWLKNNQKIEIINIDGGK